MPKKRRRTINGRAIEKVLYDNIVKNNASYWIYRYNENRWASTPCDIELQTSRYNIHIEVKATAGDYILKSNVRKNQIDDLVHYHQHRKENLSILAFYFESEKKFVFVDIISFIDKAKRGRISFSEAVEIGHLITSWKTLDRIFRRISESS